MYMKSETEYIIHTYIMCVCWAWILNFLFFSPSVDDDDRNEDEKKRKLEEEEEVEEVKDVDGEKQLVYVFFQIYTNKNE